MSTILANPPICEPIVTAEKYMEYKRKNGHLKEFTSPQIVMICYQQSTLKYLLESVPHINLCESFSNLYLLNEGRIGVLGGWGIGAPALSIKVEELIALGVKKFIAVGTAGTLMDRHLIGDFIIAPKALAEDGVAHLYLNGETFAKANEELFCVWNEFINKQALPHFHESTSWSFSAIFRETPADIIRVTKQGCHVVEMEAATLYAIGHEKNVQTLSLFVISDSLNLESWAPHIQETIVKKNLHKLAVWVLQFCKETSQVKD